MHLNTRIGARNESAGRLDSKKLRAFIEETRTVSNMASMCPQPWVGVVLIVQHLRIMRERYKG